MNALENLTPQQRTARLFSFGVAAVSLLFLGLFSYTMRLGYAEWQTWTIWGGLVLLLATSLYAARLSRVGRHEWGILSMLGVMFLLELASSFLVRDVGTALGAGIVAITLTISAGTLQRRPITRIFLTSLVVGLLATMADLLAPSWRMALPNAQLFVLGFSALATAAFAIATLREFRAYPLPTKLLVALVSLTMAASLGQTIFTLSSMQNALRVNAQQALLGAAQQSAAEVDRYLNSNLATVEASAQLPILAEYLQTPKEERTTSSLDSDINQFMRNLRSADKKNISGYILVDSNGQVVKDTTGYMYPYSAHTTYAQRDFFQKPMETGQPYISLPQFSIKPNPATPYFYLAAPIKTPLEGEIVGVLAARFRADSLQNLIASQNGLEGAHSFAALYAPLAGNLVQLAHGTRPELTLALVGPEQVTTLVSLQNKGYLSLPYMTTLTLEDTALLQALQNETDEAFFTVASSYALPEGQSDTGPFQGVHISLQTAPWILAYYEPQGAILAGLRDQLRSSQIVSIGIIIAATLLAVFLTQVISRPLTHLEQAARSLAEGNLDVRAPETSDDEIGRLANAFNSMAEQLKTTLDEMEERIARRTAEAERRSGLIATAARVGRVASQIREPERLLPQAAQLISERFGFYHVGIFLIDERGEYAVLQASNSLGGQRMLEKGHKLKVEDTSIVGYAAKHRQPRIALDVGKDAVYFDNPNLPNTRSEIAIPLVVGDEVLGVLDVQSTEQNAFSEEDVEIMQLLADQTAIAIANARLFARNQQALEEIRRAYEDVTRKAWQTLLDGVQDISLSNFGTETLPIEPVWDPASRQVAASGRPLAASQPDEKGRYRLILPVETGGVTLGVVSAYKEGLPWSAIEISLLENILRELGLALESSRLFEESRRRVQLEQARAQVVTHLRETLDTQAMLRIAAQEIRKALDLPEVSVRVAPPSSSDEPSASAA